MLNKGKKIIYMQDIKNIGGTCFIYEIYCNDVQRKKKKGI